MRELLVSFILANIIVSGERRVTRNGYIECQRANCTTLTDRDINWAFDQPEPFYLNSDIKSQQLEYPERLNITFKSVLTAKKDSFEDELPKLIHMIWIGSPLPYHKFAASINSYINLNPEYKLYLWLDHPDSVHSNHDNIVVRDLTKEYWRTEDMIKKSSNFAMKSDVMRLEILWKYGGIYVDIDSFATRSFGPVFHRGFMAYRHKNWAKEEMRFSFLKEDSEMGSAGFNNNIMGFAKDSAFLDYVLNALQENFPTVSETIAKTGPLFLKEAILQYPFNEKIRLLR